MVNTRPIRLFDSPVKLCRYVVWQCCLRIPPQYPRCPIPVENESDASFLKRSAHSSEIIPLRRLLPPFESRDRAHRNIGSLG